MNICVYGASSDLIDNSFIEAGEQLGEIIAQRNHTLIFGGGDNGMMGAAARGAFRKGGYIIAITPKFLNVDGVLFQNCNEKYMTEGMRDRKKMLDEKSDAFVISAGGVGTFDEFFEMLTLKQLGRHKKPLVILNTNNYFDEIIKMLNKCVDWNFMSKKSLELFKVVNTPLEAVEYIENYKGELADIKKMKYINNK